MQSILILDDDPGMHKALTHTLTSHRYKVTCAKTTDEAVEHLENQTFDLILVDYAMPEHDGMWFLQNTLIPRETKVLLITGYGTRELIGNMFSLGIHGYMMKPIDEEMLLHNIQFYLGEPVMHESDNMDASPSHEQNAYPAE